MQTWRAIRTCIMIFPFLALGFSGEVWADIYRYRDENGVWHFTNVATDARYRLYLRSSGKKAKEYIKDYSGIIEQASQRFGVEGPLIKAVIKAESNFDSSAVSSKGAQGLMQLMPQTAEEVEVEDPFSAEENIFGGTRYLGQLMKRFEGDKRLALAAYNAGPERVESYNGIPPFPETEAFVERVLKYYRFYSSEGAGP